MKSTAVNVYDCSMVSPLALIFFGKQVSWGHADLGTGNRSETGNGLGGEVIQVDNFVKFNCTSGTGDLVKFAKSECRLEKIINSNLKLFLSSQNPKL